MVFCLLFDFSSEKKNVDNKMSASSKRFYFEHIELRAVEVILTLLPAIDLPVDLQVIKNDLGIPHQLPPRIENACLYFGKHQEQRRIIVFRSRSTLQHVLP